MDAVTLGQPSVPYIPSASVLIKQSNTQKKGMQVVAAEMGSDLTRHLIIDKEISVV